MDGVNIFVAMVIRLFTLATLFATGNTSCLVTDSLGFFFTHPENTVVKEGQNIMFRCSAFRSDPKNTVLRWKVEPDIYNKEITNTNISFQVNSTLTIHNIGRRTQKLTCVMYAKSKRQELCQKSRTASSIVNFFPRQDEVKCQPKTFPMPFYENEIINVRCYAPRSRPPVDMSWFKGDGDDSQNTINVKRSYLEDGLLRVMEAEIYATRQLHLRTIGCKVTSIGYFPGKQRACETGMLTVYHLPQVYTFPKALHINCENGLFSILLGCKVTAYPEDISFAWTCSPTGLVEGCESQRNRADITVPYFPNVTDVVAISISCSVSNSVGNSSDTFQTALHLNESYICDVNEGGIKSHTKTSNTFQLLDFFCLLDTFHVSMLMITWFSDSIEVRITTVTRTQNMQLADNVNVPEQSVFDSKVNNSFICDFGIDRTVIYKLCRSKYGKGNFTPWSQRFQDVTNHTTIGSHYISVGSNTSSMMKFSPTIHESPSASGSNYFGKIMHDESVSQTVETHESNSHAANLENASNGQRHKTNRHVWLVVLFAALIAMAVLLIYTLVLAFRKSQAAQSKSSAISMIHAPQESSLSINVEDSEISFHDRSYEIPDAHGILKTSLEWQFQNESEELEYSSTTSSHARTTSLSSCTSFQDSSSSMSTLS